MINFAMQFFSHYSRYVLLVASIGLCLNTATADELTPLYKFNYTDALAKSWLFYEAQRGGAEQSARIPWRAVATLHDGSDVGLNLSGGWFDAGDHVKFGLPMAYAATMLAWSVNDNRALYQSSGQLTYALANLRFVTDYFLNAYVPGEPNTAADDKLAYQVGDPSTDHAFWGPPQDMAMTRPTYLLTAQRPGTEVAAQTAAALAASSLALRQNDAPYAARLLDAARQLYRFANVYRGNNGYVAARGFYDSYSGYNDELAWAAIWLYQATNDSAYLQAAQTHLQTTSIPYDYSHNWDNVAPGALLLIWRATRQTLYADNLNRHFDFWLNRISYSPGGLAWLTQWGSLRHASTAAFLALAYARDVIDPAQALRLRRFGINQINYILGDNPRRSSYIVGVGGNAPRNPHHRAAHDSPTHDINMPIINSHELTGALVGGPASADDFDWRDDRTDYIRNEVAVDYNAGFAGALAEIATLGRGALPTTPPATSTTTPTPTTTAPPLLTAQVSQKSQSDWGSGYCVDVQVRNPNTSPLAWQVNITIDGTATSAWNAKWQQLGSSLTASGAAWNTTLAAGASTSWGYCANRSSQPQTSQQQQQPPPPAPLAWTLTINNDWGSGYCAKVVVRNSANATPDWNVGIPIDGRVSNAWNVVWQQSGRILNASGVSWNKTIAANGSVEFGFCAAR